MVYTKIHRYKIKNREPELMAIFGRSHRYLRWKFITTLLSRSGLIILYMTPMINITFEKIV